MSSYPKSDVDVEGVVIDNNDGKLTAIIVNPNNHGFQMQLDLCGKLWYLELQADSISTIVVE